jgi:hypothetical protein
MREWNSALSFTFVGLTNRYPKHMSILGMIQLIELSWNSVPL